MNFNAEMNFTDSAGRKIINRRIFALGGPTCSGKTGMAIALAQSLGGQIISADSRQIFRHMTIGTAKPSSRELSLVPHHLIDIVNPDQEFTVSDFQLRAMEIICSIPLSVPVFVVGGTGLYLRSIIEGLAHLPGPDQDFRDRMEKIDSKELHALLEAKDPVRAGEVHPRNKKRIIRSLEIIEATGRPFSENISGVRIDTGLVSMQVALTWNRETLYRRIDERVCEMMDQGFVQEVRKLLQMGYGRDLNSMTSIGYRQIIDHIEGNVNLQDTLESIQKETRNFARRQLTWFRGDSQWKWFDLSQDGFDVTLNKLSVMAKDFFRAEGGSGQHPINPGPPPGPAQGGIDAEKNI
ncbi:MAG: tRNA (adenosine(37)-N6)-dimethylallyltransferase MiaA [Candidatus Wallbacteria bacterium HGW-Wallbacteria-1]|jgi:tRNA dimethylallyltransferase|uniref:tRNA dimethylallyltransferase n=1 Tax=Candidatus Wallbacteria bacterium HGW-Wallbacteria-1 TaxID=2013854 RepID=A0A2N1PQ71_9BACT|nr:MAG: tRNA (adenosine(37)-N6)-dimethylallyltransferase MiaA [Candidatus Wallbacteria bacterium HGW-Wallbacteria-1]